MGPVIDVVVQTSKSSHLVTLLSSVLPGVAATVGIVMAISTYRQNSRVQASGLVLKLEEHFNQLGTKLLFLEYRDTCYEPVSDLLRRCVQSPNSLNESERQTILDVDECLRFLFICALHAPSTLHYRDQWPWSWLPSTSRLLPEAYLYYLSKLNDQVERRWLYHYVTAYFPALRAWLLKNEEVLAARDMRKHSLPFDNLNDLY